MTDADPAPAPDASDSGGPEYDIGSPTPPDPDEFDDTPIQPSSSIGKFRRTGAGAVLNGVALGLRDVFDPVVKEEAPMVQEAPGEPDNPRPVDAHLDPDDPTASSVTVRQWRFDDET